VVQPPGLCASLDGEITLASEASIPAVDDGFLHGDGAFELVRMYDGKPFALDEHMQRLKRSAAQLRLPFDLDAVRQEAYRLLEHAASHGSHDLLRIVITRGGRRLLLTELLPPVPDRLRLCSITYSPTRILDGITSLSCAPNALATRLAQERGFDDALLVTAHGRVLEASTSSIFWVVDDSVFTPPLAEHILASITRGAVAEITGAAERVCSLDDLATADEVFVTSTVVEVKPVAAVDDRTFSTVGKVTARIATSVRRLISAAG
jgi:branched-chain amino acid aminotransferase